MEFDDETFGYVPSLIALWSLQPDQTYGTSKFMEFDEETTAQIAERCRYINIDTYVVRTVPIDHSSWHRFSTK